MSRAAGRAKKTTRRDSVVNLRMPTSMRELIDNAADMLGKTRTAFIIESSRKQAEDVLLDKRLFTLDANQYQAFLSALDETPKPNEKLRRLFARKSPWDK